MAAGVGGFFMKTAAQTPWPERAPWPGVGVYSWVAYLPSGIGTALLGLSGVLQYNTKQASRRAVIDMAGIAILQNILAIPF
jgi:hypothetical protein